MGKTAKQIRKLEDLTPDSMNTNQGTERGDYMIDWSLTNLGAGRSLLADRNGNVIAGNKTLGKAVEHGFPVRVVQTDGKELVVVQRTDLDLFGDNDEERTRARQLAEADNRASEVSFARDVEMLLTHQAGGVDLSPMYRDDEIEALRASILDDTEPGDPSDAEPQIDRAAELNKKWKVKPGDLWLIGNHRLLCGDSTNAEDVARVMGGEKAKLMNTDPPYGIAYVSNAQSKGQAGDYDEIANDELDGEKLQEFLEKCIRAAVPLLVHNAAFYLWHPMLTQSTFFAAAAAAAADILIHRQIIWIKPSLVFGRGDYHWQHELCFYGWRRGNRPDFYGERNQTTIWAAGRENDKIHPTQKPLKLFETPILNHTKAGEVVYEPFAGSGSQLVAAQNLNRRCYGIEISPDYCSVILERMSQAFPDLEIKRG